MKTLIRLLGLLSFATGLFAQGTVNFANTIDTLISVDGAPMPGANTSQFIFGLFLAPSSIVTGPSQTIAFNDLRFQFAGLYNTNHSTAKGRLWSRNNVAVSNGSPGSTVDFVVRGWSANAGATWSEALSNYNNGLGEMYVGSSTAGNNLMLGGGALAASWLFGPATNQVGGFNLTNANPCLGPYWMGFTIHPTNQSVVQGGTAVFNVGAIACPPPWYQWYFNESAIPGANKGSYRITNVQPVHAGRYFAILSNTNWPLCCGTSHMSWSAVLSVPVPPTVTSGPTSQTAEIGKRVRLTGRAAGDLPLMFHWIFNETNVLSVSTNSILELSNIGQVRSGSYEAVVTNSVGAATSAPAMLNVIAPVERRPIPGIQLTGEVGSLLNVNSADSLGLAPPWTPLDSVILTSTSQYCFDLTTPLPPQRFYRAWQTMSTNSPALGLNMVPALTLIGSLGDKVRVDGINQFGPTNAWFTLDTVTLTNTSQLYFDVTAPGQPARLYRLVPVP